MTAQEWHEIRRLGIGASDAAAVIGQSPYKTNVELWEEKTGIRIPADISNKPFVKYGTEAERHLRGLFALDHPEYTVCYRSYDVIRNEKYPFIFSTLDGSLYDIKNEIYGVLEIKTTEIMRSNQWSQWDDRTPQHYYIQLLHQLLSTGFDFALLRAQIKSTKNGKRRAYIVDYYLDKRDAESDIAFLLEKEINFWECVKAGKEPPLILPDI